MSAPIKPADPAKPLTEAERDRADREEIRKARAMRFASPRAHYFKELDAAYADDKLKRAANGAKP